MKQLIAATATTVLVSMGNLAIAADSSKLRHQFADYANVIDVQPVYRRIRHEEPHKECWIVQEERVVTREGSRREFGRSNRRSSSRNYNGGDALVGGIIGGVIGNQLGKRGKRGKRTGATVAGAIVGSVIANEARGGSNISRHRNNRNSGYHQPQRVVTTYPVERCRETIKTSYEKRIQAYDVTYEYRGETFTTRTKREPGNQIELQVIVAPARY